MEDSRRFGRLKSNVVYPGSSYPKFQGDYRPVMIAEPSGDELETAGRQANIDQFLEEVIAMRDGEYREEIYAGAEASVAASEFFGMKRRTSVSERRLDVERSAWAIASARTRDSETMVRTLAERTINALLDKATNVTRRRYLEQRFIPVYYKALGIVQLPPPTR